MQYGYAYQLGERAGGLDPDAKAYILAVEAADGQSLESGVKKAYNTFVKGCKSDGTWDAIKASCITVGARTLSGALVPLKGTAPTNFNFDSTDYNRETGLIGGGSKYLNSNRNNNADPQDNQHISIYASTIGANFFVALNDPISTGASTLGTTVVRSRNSTSVSWTTTTGFNGISRSTGSNFISRSQSTNQTNSSVSQTPQNSDITIMRGNVGGALSYGTHRLSFYSIGEAVDLAKLDSRVSTLMSNIATAIP